MSIDVRPSEDADRFLATDQLVWFGETTVADEQHLRLGLPEDQRFVVDLPAGPEGLHAGIYGVRPMEMSLPGGSLVPVAGLTWVGVHPDSRRRGVLTAMIADHLTRTHEAGLALSVLHASEAGIYGRFGYGSAVLMHQATIGRGTTFTAPHLDGAAAATSTHLLTMADDGVADRMRACQLAQAPDFPGTVVGTPEFARLLALETPEELRDKEQRRVLFARRDGRDVGWVGLRRDHKWEKARPSGTVTVGTFCGDPAARLALARRVVDLDLMGSVKLETLGLDDPLLAWVGGPRDTGELETWDSTWVRLVDLGAAWSQRAYEGDCDVVVEVEDRHAPWNAGRWRLTASAGTGSASRTDSPADLTLDVAVLGAGYLGRGTGGRLRAGLVAEHRPGAYAELARAMRTLVEPEPSIGF